MSFIGWVECLLVWLRGMWFMALCTVRWPSLLMRTLFPGYWCRWHPPVFQQSQGWSCPCLPVLWQVCDPTGYFCLCDFAKEYQVLEKLLQTSCSISALSKISGLYLCGSISGIQTKIVFLYPIVYTFLIFDFWCIFKGKISYTSD